MNDVKTELALQQAFQRTLDLALRQGVQYHQAGQLPEAEEFYRTILQEQPEHPQANHNMGVLAVQMGQPQASLPYFRRVFQAPEKPQHYWLSYIEALLQSDELLEAKEALVQSRRDGWQSLEVLGLVLRFSVQLEACLTTSAQSKDGRDDKTYEALHTATPPAQETGDAFALYQQSRFDKLAQRALDMAIGYPLAPSCWKMLGAAMQNLRQFSAAEASYRRALELRPEDADVCCNLAVTLHEQRRFEEAQACYRRALEIKPDLAVGHNNLGNVLKVLGQLKEAEACYRQAIRIAPDYAEAYFNLADVLNCQGQSNEESLRRGIALNPAFFEAHNNLGVTLFLQGRLSEAEDCYRRSLEISPDYAWAHSNLLFCLIHNHSLPAQALFEEHLRFAQQFEAPLRASWAPHGNVRDPDRCLQIGFVSPDLRDHAIASFIEPVLVHLAGYPELSLHAYYTHAASDSVTERLKGYLTHWHAVADLSDDALAERIRADGIDILIDLSGHTAENRLLTFARKPAPLQASWMGYPGTTGLQAMDYYFSDRFMHPAGHPIEAQYTEKIVRLPAGAPFLPVADAPAVSTLPALENGFLTFGSFNHLSKINPQTIALWSQLLSALPDSRMLIGGMGEGDGPRDRLIEWFAREGIARERLVFHPRCDIQTYLRLHHQVDICLDAIPYGGGTTTYHALWMGVPTLSLAGRTMPERLGLAIQSHQGLAEFAADDEAAYVQKGIDWAHDLNALAEVRTTLRERMRKSPSGQPALIAAGVERALRSMWQRWCSGLPVQSFEVDASSLDGRNHEVAQ